MTRTVRWYLTIASLSRFGMSFIAATYVIFLRQHGLNYFQVNLVNVVFWTTLLLCELPTGTLADRYGRRRCMVASSLLVGVGMALYGFGSTFLVFALAEAIAAVGSTLRNGAFQAWLIAGLEREGKSAAECLTRVIGWEYGIGWVASSAGAVLGAAIAVHHPTYPWFIAGAVSGSVGLITAWFVPDTAPHQRSRESLWSVLPQSYRYLISQVRTRQRHPAIWYVLVTGFFLAFATQAPNMQWQPQFRSFLQSEQPLGVIFTGIAATFALGSLFAIRIVRLCAGEQRAMTGILVVTGAGIGIAAVAGSLPVALLSFYLHEVGRGALVPIKTVYLNRYASEDDRATLLSLGSLPSHLGGILGLLASGWVALHASIPVAWIGSGSILILGTLITARRLADVPARR